MIFGARFTTLLKIRFFIGMKREQHGNAFGVQQGDNSKATVVTISQEQVSDGFDGEKPLDFSAYPASVPWCHPREPRSSHGALLMKACARGYYGLGHLG